MKVFIARVLAIGSVIALIISFRFMGRYEIWQAIMTMMLSLIMAFNGEILLMKARQDKFERMLYGDDEQ